MSLPFSRFSAIKGLSKPLACPTLGPSFWGVGAIAMRCSPKKWMSNLLGVTGKTSYLLLMVQNSQGQPLVMLIKPLKKKTEKNLATSTGDFWTDFERIINRILCFGFLGFLSFSWIIFSGFFVATDLRLRLTCKVRVVQHELIESLTSNPSSKDGPFFHKLLDPNSWRNNPPNMEPKLWAPRWMLNHMDSHSVWNILKLHPKKRTWTLKTMVCNRNLLFMGSIFRCYVKILGE